MRYGLKLKCWSLLFLKISPFTSSSFFDAPFAWRIGANPNHRPSTIDHRPSTILPSGIERRIGAVAVTVGASSIKLQWITMLTAVTMI